MKKVLSILMASVLFFATFAIGISAERSHPSLRFNEDGKFRILQVADLQDNAVLNPVAKDFLKAAIENEKPDLIVLTGDNFAGYSTGTNICHTIDKSLAKKAIDEYMSIFEKYGIPVTMVPGNHDDDDIKLTKEEELAMYEKYTCFIGYDAEPEMYGCGTHNLPIYSSKNAYKLSYNLWMFDSNTYDEELGGYDYVHDDQVEWYVNKSNELKAANDGNVVPSMVFQHIIVKEIYDIIEECPAGTPNSMERDGKTYKFKDENYKTGNFKEWPCPGTRPSKQFGAMVDQGDVVAMFFGHDHNNSFEVSYKGIDLVATPGFTFSSYGNEDKGFRVIDLDESDTSSYETHLVHWKDYYGSNKMAMNHYNMYAQENSGWIKFISALKYIPFALIKVLFGYIF